MTAPTTPTPSPLPPPPEPSGATPTAALRPRPRLWAIFVYTLQSCVPPRRWAAVIAACVGSVLFGLLARAIDTGPDRAFAYVATEGILSLAVPIAALVIGDAVLGAEIRGGTFMFTWMTPSPVWQIVLGRWLGGSLVALVTIVPACALAALVSGARDGLAQIVVASAAGAVAYVALFIAIGCLTRRTAVWSLAIVFLVERLLGAALTGIAQISPQWESRAAFVGLLDNPPTRLIREGVPSGGSALIRLMVISFVALAVATWRMRHLRLTGASD
ncbi:MAG: hypothetical protein ABW328_10165 [Ilumatobacteraceae bacterium]